MNWLYFIHTCADLFLYKLNMCNYLWFDGDSYPDKVLGESQPLINADIYRKREAGTTLYR